MTEFVGKSVEATLRALSHDAAKREAKSRATVVTVGTYYPATVHEPRAHVTCYSQSLIIFIFYFKN